MKIQLINMQMKRISKQKRACIAMDK